MEVHQHRHLFQLFQNAVHFGKGIVGIEIHAAAADQVDYGNGSGIGFENAAATARQLGREIGRPQAAVCIIQPCADLPAVPCVVPEGNDIGAGIEDLLSLTGRHAHHGGILTVDHTEVDPVFPAQAPKLLLQERKTRLSYHVTHCQYTNFHTQTHLSCCFFTIIPQGPGNGNTGILCACG